MIVDMETETEAYAPPSSETPLGVDAATPVAPRRRVNPYLLGIVLLVLLGAAIGWHLYSRRVEDTDDAQVDGHLNPIAARIDGTIKAVYVDDNQRVEGGALLMELDPSDDQVALKQAQAQHDQARAQLGASHPNLSDDGH